MLPMLSPRWGQRGGVQGSWKTSWAMLTEKIDSPVITNAAREGAVGVSKDEWMLCIGSSRLSGEDEAVLPARRRARVRRSRISGYESLS